MLQTSYISISGLHSRLQYDGGFCRFWFIPIEHITAWPSVDPETQYLDGEPTLDTDRAWFGPILVPDSQRGYTEEAMEGGGGFFYRQKVNGIHPGDSGPSRINHENLPYHRFAVVGKQRAGGLYMLLGSEHNWFTFRAGYKTGGGAIETAAHEFQFTGESIFKAQLLTTFEGETIDPPGYSMTNQTEIITFTTESTKNISWTSNRAARFGVFPEIQCWVYNTSGDPELTNLPITADAGAPDQTAFTVYLPGTAGFIVLK